MGKTERGFIKDETSFGSHIGRQLAAHMQTVCVCEGGSSRETKFRVSACSSICLRAFGLHVCTPLCVCVCVRALIAEVLLPYNCSNDMSSTKKKSERVDWNAMDTYKRTHVLHLRTVYEQAPL